MRLFLALSLGSILSALPSLAQTIPASTPASVEQTTQVITTLQTEPEKVYTEVDQMPELPNGGGSAAIVSAIQKAAQYPPTALRNQVEGRVFVSFIVNPLGDITVVRVVRGLGSGLDEATIRAVGTLPKLNPGKQEGRAVYVNYTLPIAWRIH
ncbi:energy transducer TonB [Hymenobacter sp. UYCo722]|uniref:energy transducer TonB n=1 Tax=Hymenobacter sp. UYCo722 TaxID=3156335 RepID=UPI0033956D9E